MTSAAPTAVPNLVQIHPWGAFSQIGELITKICFIYIFSGTHLHTCQTRRRIFRLNGSNDADSRKGVPFGGVVDIASHFGGEIPLKLQF